MPIKNLSEAFEAHERHQMLAARLVALESCDRCGSPLMSDPAHGCTFDYCGRWRGETTVIGLLTRWIRELEAELGEERVRALIGK